MIGFLLRRGIRRFAGHYNYDAGYMTHVSDVSTSAGVRLALLPTFTQYRGPSAARDLWAGAMLASTLDGDCGPCVQLVVDMALEAQVPEGPIALCLQGAPDQAGDVGLGFRFARASIADQPELEDLRSEIERRFGPEAVVAAAFAASSGRIYPVLKRGLGFGQICSSITLGHNTVRTRPAP
jgi:hypothetical protein